MTQDQVADDANRPAVIEWNGGAESVPGRRRSPLAGILRRPWLVPLLAGLGAVAVFASLIGEWVVISIDPQLAETMPPDMRIMINRLTDPGPFDMGPMAAAYVVGVVVLASTVVLALFGTPTTRRTVSLAGLGTAGAMLAIVVAIQVNLDSSVRARFYYDPNMNMQAEPGRGMIMAYAGTVALGLALLLARRLAPAESTVDRPAEDDPQPAAEIDWPWRRPRTAAVARDDDRDDPIDLTVTPTRPFAHPE